MTARIKNLRIYQLTITLFNAIIGNLRFVGNTHKRAWNLIKQVCLTYREVNAKLYEVLGVFASIAIFVWSMVIGASLLFLVGVLFLVVLPSDTFAMALSVLYAVILLFLEIALVISIAVVFISLMGSALAHFGERMEEAEA